MPTPAEILLENSTLLSGTPWEHLNSQEGGTGTGETIFVEAVLSSSITDSLSSYLVVELCEASIEDSLSANIEDTEVTSSTTTDTLST